MILLIFIHEFTTIANALQRIDEPSYDKAKKIMSLLQKFSKMTSYGLPVGGAASRILAELALNKIDNLLAIRGIKFKRFVDDYYIFCNSSGEARIKLGELSTLLMQNLGLTIQKHKLIFIRKKSLLQLQKLNYMVVKEEMVILIKIGRDL